VQKLSCPALFISAPGSGHGKTTVTAALARLHADSGRRVRVFKAGPDFLDPMIHARASGHPVYQLDLWMAGEAQCRRMVAEAAGEADLILIEGVMGLFDGEPSSADLAALLGVPVLAVINATGVAQTFGAIAQGLARYHPKLPFAGVLANNVASDRHEDMIQQGMPDDLAYWGGLRRTAEFSLPQRHLGLTQAQEIDGLDTRLSAVATSIEPTRLARLPARVAFEAIEPEPLPMLLAGVRIGVARDAAFSFIYQANLDLLQAMGAELEFFSPLANDALPDVDSVYLPGGYPEMHLTNLQKQTTTKTALTRHVNQQKPLYAECGGMLYLLESLTDKSGARAAMAGVLPGRAVMQQRLQGLGYQTAPMPGGDLRGHTFHYSVIDTPMAPVASGIRLFNTSAGERIFQRDRLVATYLHCYFPSNPTAAASLFLP
jgi:cobyrinic acid a,c-diamide synthase